MGAFNVKTGSVTLDFDKDGQIKSIKKEELFRPVLTPNTQERII